MMMRTNLPRTPARAVRYHLDSGGRDSKNDLIKRLADGSDRTHRNEFDTAIAEIVQASDSRPEGDVTESDEVSGPHVAA